MTISRTVGIEEPHHIPGIEPHEPPHVEVGQSLALEVLDMAHGAAEVGGNAPSNPSRLCTDDRVCGHDGDTAHGIRQQRYASGRGDVGSGAA